MSGRADMPDGLVGKLILRDDPAFEAARTERVLNRRLPHRRPAAVLKVAHENALVLDVRPAR